MAIKVIILSTVAGFGGAERVVQSIMNSIDKENVDAVGIFFSKSGKEPEKFFKGIKDKSLKIYKILLTRSRFKYLNPVLNIIELYTILKKEDANLIHSHGYRADVIGVIIAKILNIPIISTCHGYISTNKILRFYNFIDRLALRFFNKIISVSETIKRDLVKAGVKKNKVLVIQNCISFHGLSRIKEEFRDSMRDKVGIHKKDMAIGYIGRLEKEKGLEYLLKAGSNLCKEFKNLIFILVGAGDYRVTLEKMSKELKLNLKTIFVGFQSEPEKWLSAFDIFVLPSITEGTPMVLLEAMSIGVPVVATSVGGIPDIIESEKEGILISPGSSIELETGIKNILTKNVDTSRLTNSARKKIEEKFNFEKWIKKLEAVYFKQAKNLC
ncbi:glycosyltransferase family 4 protein [Thermodesulfobacteriota bacterium]